MFRRIAVLTIIFALAALGVVLTCAVFFYSSDCPKHSFLIGSAIVMAGSSACNEADIEPAKENPTEKILNGGI